MRWPYWANRKGEAAKRNAWLAFGLHVLSFFRYRSPLGENVKGGIQGRDVRKPRDAVTTHPSLERNSFCEDVSPQFSSILRASAGIGGPWNGVVNV